MRLCAVLLLSILSVVQSLMAADVVAVPEAGVVVLELADVPVSFPLAHIAVPDNEEIRTQSLALLKSLAEGQKLRIKYDASFGDVAGTGRVHLLKSTKSINVKLLEAGLAQYVPGTDAENRYAKKMADAQDRAKTAKKGMWSKTFQAALAKSSSPSQAKEAGATKTKIKSETKTVAKGSSKTQERMKASAKYCAELSGKYFYAVNSKKAQRLNQRKVVYYKTEKEALAAGKKAYQERKTEKVAQTMENADALMAKGRAHYTKAVDMPGTYERDKEYGEAFRYLTQAMLIYRSFYEKDESNDELGETLRVCMEMRYGAMKNKRP